MAGTEPVQKLLSMAGLLAPAAIRAAATLGVADHLAAGARTSAEVAERAGTRPDVTDALLRYLADLGLLRAVDGGFELTEVGAPLRSDHRFSVRPLLRNDGLFGGSALGLMHLDHTVRTGEPGYAAEFGRRYWDAVNTDPAFVGEWEEQARAADRAADGPLAWDAGAIVDGYDWSTVRRVVDVGGHLGAITLALLRAHPHLHGTLVDLPNVAAQAARRLAASDVAGRATVVTGSFFDPLPADADVYLLSAILADWSDDDAVLILKRCREAAGERGRVLLAEVIMPAPNAAAELELRSMMPAPTRTVEQLEALATAAGFTVTWRGPQTPVRVLLELTPA